jgi:hypothetical protein
MASVADEIEDIRREMARLRLNLYRDVSEVVAVAEAVSDWRNLVRLHPWAFLVGAFGLGFLLVPRRRRSIRATAEAAATVAAAKMKASAGVPMLPRNDPESRSGLFVWVLSLIAPVALRAAQAYAARYIESRLARQVGPDPAVSSFPMRSTV